MKLNYAILFGFLLIISINCLTLENVKNIKIKII
jgi:hypothetical protein